jgi:branched-chain amino acid aminotransferase
MLQVFNEKNRDIQVYVKDGLYHRSEAKVSVLDSVVQGGDAVWEGIRVYKGGVFLLDRHLDRLYDSAHALAFENVPMRDAVKEAIFSTLRANDMYDDTHIRLTLTRGEKITSGMDPRLNQEGCCIIVLAEWKPPVYNNDHGIRVITSTIRRNSPMHLDSKIHHNNLLNNIQAKIQSNFARVDAALMLDAYGYASELHGTNVFMIKNDTVYTPHADACLPGITRGLVIEICKEENIPCVEKNLSLTELYNADLFFCTGSMGEITPIVELDGREISGGTRHPLLEKIRLSFEQKIPKHSEKIPNT